MASLTGTNKYLDTYYKDLFHISNSALGLDSTIRYMYDGNGTATVLGLSTTGVTVNGTFKISTGTFVSGGAYTYTFPAFSGTVATLAGTETFTNKTITAPILSGSITGTYTLAGTPTITSPTINTPTITSPTLTTPILGTPSSGTLTSCTGLPIATGVSGLGTGVATFLATPSSANLKSALTDETGSGAAVFATSPTLVTPLLGTPTSGTLTNCTGLLETGVTGAAWTDYSGSVTYGGFSGTPTTTTYRYKQIGSVVHVIIDMSGTSNANTFTISLPIAAAYAQTIALARVVNNSTTSTAVQYGSLTASSTTLTLTLGDSNTGWTTSNTKGCRTSFYYSV